MIKIHGGTKSDDHLCLSCHWCHRITHANHEVSICELLKGCTNCSPVISERVVACTEYRKIDQPSKHDLEEIAWKIELKGGRFIGFKRPENKSDD